MVMGWLWLANAHITNMSMCTIQLPGIPGSGTAASISMRESISAPPPYQDVFPDGPEGLGLGQEQEEKVQGKAPSISIPGSARDSVGSVPEFKIVEQEPSAIHRASISSVDSVAEQIRRDHAASLQVLKHAPAVAQWEENPLAGERYDPPMYGVEGYEGKQHDDGPKHAALPSASYASHVSHVSQVAFLSYAAPVPEMDGRKRPSVIVRMNSVRLNEFEEEQLQYAPLFTILVAIVDIVLFIITMGENNWTFESYNVNPMFGPSAQTEIEMGAKYTARILDGEWWRLIAPMFLHSGIIHLALNMLVLVRMAKDFEESFGTVRLVIIYLSSGVFGTILSAIFIPDIIGVGASGALFGLLGASWGDLFHNWSYMTEGRNWYIFRLAISSIGGLCIGLLPYIDNFAHIGGWICGVIAGSCVMIGSMRDPSSGVRRYRNKLLFIISLALLIIIFVIGIAVLYGNKDANKWCSWCHYLTCVPTPWWDCNVQMAQQCLQYPNGTIVSCHPL